MDEHGRRRIEDPSDFVRIEITAALEQNLRVIPVLVDRATCPTVDELPEALRPLVRRHAIELTDSRWAYDVGKLIENLARAEATNRPIVTKGPSAEPSDSRPKEDEPFEAQNAVPEQAAKLTRSSRSVVVGIAVAAVVLASGIAVSLWPGSSTRSEPTETISSSLPTATANVPSTTSDSVQTSPPVESNAQRPFPPTDATVKQARPDKQPEPKRSELEATSVPSPSAKDTEPRIVSLNRECDAGDLASCSFAASIYEEGKSIGGNSVQKDEARAITLYQRACDGGRWDDCRVLGLKYEHARGVSKDVPRALLFYQRACDGGNAYGCFHAGAVLRLGSGGITRDYKRAFALYERSCELSQDYGCDALGDMYADGLGVAQDDTRAVSLYRRACDARNHFGCINLGRTVRRWTRRRER